LSQHVTGEEDADDECEQRTGHGEIEDCPLTPLEFEDLIAAFGE
jgi:hypothetical protein